jgi:uncharacterized membrane protein
MTPFGILHTAISMVAVISGAIALARHKLISTKNRVGQLYVVTTAVTAITALGIFHHGGFGKPHALAILTLLALGVAGVAGATQRFGSASRYVETVAYSTTFFFHMIPLVTETSTRLPVGAPLVASPDAPELQVVTAFLLTAFLVGATLQVLRLRGGFVRARV